jgi:PAS domain S-box-containing protein
LRLLRVMGNLSAGVLYIPLLQCLLIPPPVPASAALLACASILCIVLVTLALLFSSVFYEANSLSKSTDAKVHGRCDVVLVLVQTALVVQASFEDESPLLRMVVFFIGGLVWLGSILYALPFLHHSMNRAVAAGATLFVWCTVCYTLNVSMRWTDAAIQLYCGLPLALLSGMFLADVRAHNVLLTPDGLLSNAVEVELKCRYLTAEALWGHALFRVREAGGGIGSWDDVVEDGTFGVTLSSRVPSATARLGASAVTDKGTSGEAAPRTVAVSIEDDPDAEEMRHLRARLPAATTRHVLAIYSAAASRFRSSALLQVFYARYYEFVLGNRHMQMSHMTQAERRSPALDLSFVVFQARKAAEDESTGAGGERMTVMVRVAYEKHTGEAKRFVQQASQKQHLFWAELVSVMPDMSRLHRLSSGTNTAVQAAEQAFADLHAINPHSLPMNRLCAAFHLHVTGNAEQAAALTQAADRQEEAQSKDHRLEGSAPLRIMAESGLDPWADNTSVVHIAATVRDVGLITKVNTEALKLFGYTRVQLERRSVFTLLPPGLGELHEDSMRSYMATGEGVPGVVGYTRISFAVIKSGAIVPVVSSIRDAPADDGPPAFSWAMREIRTALHYVLLDDGGTITALSSGSAAAFELDLSAFANGGSDSRMMADLVVEWTVPGVQAALLEQAGASLRVDIVNSDELIGEAQSVDGSVHGSFDAPDDDDASSTDEAILQALDERPARPLQVGNSRVPGFSAATSFWVHAQLQPIGLGPRGLHKGFVLSWSRIMESDVSAIAKAEARRNAYLNNSGSRSALKPVLSPRLGLSLPSTTPLQVQVVSARRSSTLFTARSSIAPPSAMQLAATAKASRMLAESAHSLPSAAAANAATPKAPGTEGSSQRERSRATAPARTHKTSGDAKSHDSGSSSSSTIASTMRSMARLRKILSNDSPPLLPGLFALTIAGAILTVLGLVLAIVGLTISGTILSEVKEDLEYVQAGSLRMVQKASAILAAQNLLYIARNWTTTSTGETSRYRAQIQGNATAFMDSHKRMYEIVRATDRSYDWTSRFITTRIFGAAQGGLDGSTVQRNLYEAGVAFGDLMQTLSSVVQMPLSVYRTYADGSSLGEPTLALMHTEYFRGGNSHDVMENSLGLGYSILTGSIEGLKVTQMYIVIGMTGAIALVFFAIFLPILSAIDRSADAIMLEFINLPLPIRRNLHDQAFRRARLLRRDYSADADDDDMFDDDDDDDVQAQEDMLRAAEEGEVDATDGLTVDWADMAAQAGLSSKRGAGLTTFTSTRVHRNSLAVKSGPALPTYKKSRASFGRFILRFSVPLGILVVYFVAICECRRLHDRRMISRTRDSPPPHPTVQISTFSPPSPPSPPSLPSSWPRVSAPRAPASPSLTYKG